MAKILFFGKLKDMSPNYSIELEIPSTITDIASLRKYVDKAVQMQGALLEPDIRVAVGGELCSEPAAFHGADEVAFLPPVGGG